MAETLTQMTDHFSLAHFERALDGFVPPDEPFDPHGAWQNTYRIVECSQGMRAIGALRIARQPLGEGRAELRIEERKVAVGGSLHCEMQLQCATDELASPRSWTLETVANDTEGNPVEDTRLAEAGRARPAALQVRTGSKARRIPVERPYTFQWSLFDAVQRLDPELPSPLEFTLVDRLNYELKPNQRLAYRTSAHVELGGTRTWKEEKQELEVGTVYRPVPAREGAVATQLRAYEQLGDGILPTVYWVDGRGRLLLVVSGLIGHIFDPEAEV